MLRAMRSGAILKYVFLALLAMAAGGLVMMDVQGMFRGGGMEKKTVASVAGEDISSIDLDQLVQMEMRRAQMTQAEAWRAGLPHQVLRNEVNSRIFSLEARDAGLLIDDATAAVAIRDQVIAPLAKQGMMEHEALGYVLQSLGVSERQLMQNVKMQLAAENLLRVVSGGAHAPAQMVNDALKYRYESRQAEYFTLGAKEIGAVPAPTQDDLVAHYMQTRSRYMLPEYRTLAVLTLDAKALGLDAAVTDAEVQAYYADNIRAYSTPETREIAQVAVKDEATANELRAAAVAAKDLRKAVESFGEAGLNVVSGTYSEDDIAEELQAAAFEETAPGEISAPVESPLGWHLVHVVKVVTPGESRPLAAVRDDIEKQLTLEKSADLIYEHADEIDDAIASGGSLADIAAKYGLTPIVLEKVDPDGIPAGGGKADARGIPMFDKVIETGFALDEGAVSQLIETDDGAFVLVAAREVFPADAKPITDVAEEVLQSWRAEQKNNLLDNKAAEVMERLNLGESFDKVAESFGKQAARSKPLRRNSPAADAPLGKGMIPALFSLDKIGETTTVRGEDSLSFMRMIAREVEMPAQVEEQEAKSMQLMLSQSLQNDLLEQYRRGLMDKYDVTVRADVVEKLYAPAETVE